MAYANRPFTVLATVENPANPRACSVSMTHCASLAGAIRSAKGFAPCYTSLVILHNDEVVKVIR